MVIGGSEPAFPNDVDCGMTLRDWFAGKALPCCKIRPAGEGPVDIDAAARDLAIAAYKIADYLLAEREREEPSDAMIVQGEKG